MDRVHANWDGKQSFETQFKMLYNTLIRPFIAPYLEITTNTIPKLIISAGVLVVTVLTTLVELIDTPKTMWIGLMALVALDFLAGTTRAIFDKDVKFSFHKWTRTAYKFPAYLIAIISTALAGNMYPEIFGWIQYVVIAILTGMEVFSILRNMKMFGVLYVLGEVAQKKGWPSYTEFLDKVRQKEKEIASNAEKEDRFDRVMDE